MSLCARLSRGFEGASCGPPYPCIEGHLDQVMLWPRNLCVGGPPARRPWVQTWLHTGCPEDSDRDCPLHGMGWARSRPSLLPVTCPASLKVSVLPCQARGPPGLCSPLGVRGIGQLWRMRNGHPALLTCVPWGSARTMPVGLTQARPERWAHKKVTYRRDCPLAGNEGVCPPALGQVVTGLRPRGSHSAS